jgi:uncharacterized protein (DUF1810 family)
MNAADPFGLNRFVAAQEAIYATVLSELRAGKKRTHWMWFIFPQLAGLGSSPMAERYAIRSAAEARAYLAHEVLGPRLLECTATVLALEDRTVSEVFRFPDDLKLKSSMTLYAQVTGPDSDFARVLAKYFDGMHDERTLELLRAGS